MGKRPIRLKRLSTYWKFQIIGWNGFTMVDVVVSTLYLSFTNDSALLAERRRSTLTEQVSKTVAQ